MINHHIHLLVLLFLVLGGFAVQAQSQISGKIVDSNNEPVIGASVVVKNTTKGAITDINGAFSFSAEVGDDLVITMLGMKTLYAKASDGKMSLVMEEDSEVLEEVVVNGFQEVDRRLFTGVADYVNMDEVKVQGMVDASRMLEGRVAGVTVDNVSGTFGTAPKIRIRGNASINGNNQPLYVVDGVILEDVGNVNTDDFISGNASTLTSSSIANINPSDIESYQILKDASATAIYGARAANGVIVINTKRGKSGALSVNYSGNYSFKLRPTYDQFNLLNSEEEISVFREMERKGNIQLTTSVRSQTFGALGDFFNEVSDHNTQWGRGGSINEAYINEFENTNTDWFDELFNDYGFQQQHTLSLTTGTDKSTSYYSLGYLNDEGQTIADKVQRLTATARNSYSISDKFNFGLKLTGSYRQQEAPGTRNREFDPITGTFSRNFDINPLSYALNTSRSMRSRDELGQQDYFRRNYANFNIHDELRFNTMDIEVLDVSTQTDFDFQPIKDLSIKGVLQYRLAQTKRDHQVDERSNQAEAYRANDNQFFQNSNNLLFRDPDNPGLTPQVVLPQGGFNYLDRNELLSFFGRYSIEYSKDLGPNHVVNLLGGQEIRFSDREENTNTAIGVVYQSGGLVVTDPNAIEFFNQQNIDINTFSRSSDRFVGFFLNGGYAFREKYIVNFTVRYDGSNQLGRSQDARFLPTWNVSGAWNLHKEGFMQSLSFLDELKLRGTYGISGNLPPEASALLNLQGEVTNRPDDIEPFLFIEDLTNEDLTWEKLKELNVGLDLGVYNNRIFTTVDFYRRESFDLIGQVLTSGVGGQGVKFGNFADMESLGFEFTINTLNVSSGDFTWRTNFNIGYTRDEITRLDFGPRLNDAMTENGAAVLGGPRRGLFSARFAGLSGNGIPTFFASTGEVANTNDFDLQTRDNLTNTLVYEGPTEPRGGGGLTNTFNYKGLSLSVLLTYKFDYVVRLNGTFRSDYTDFQSLPGELSERWAVPGDEEITNVPAILPREEAQTGSQDLAYSLYNQSDQRVADGSYVRLKTVRLGYQLPSRLIERVGINNASISVEGQNLALLYADEALNGQDPEFFSSGGVALPQPRQITFSINLGF